MRLGNSMSSTLGSRSSVSSSSASTPACERWRTSKCTCSERMPGVRSSRPGGLSAVSTSSRACTWKRSSRSSTAGPNSTSRLSSPAWRKQMAGRVAVAASSWTIDGLACLGGCATTGTAAAASSAAIAVSCAVSSSAASAGLMALKRRRSPGRSWPIFHNSASAIVAGQTKPPRLGPSGPRMTGMSPVKSMLPMA